MYDLYDLYDLYDNNFCYTIIYNNVMLVKKMFMRLLTRIVITSNHTKCLSLRKQKWIAQPTLINLNPNEYSQELRYYPFAVSLDRCVRSCITLNDLPNKVCRPNKTEDLN